MADDLEGAGQDDPFELLASSINQSIAAATELQNKVAALAKFVNDRIESVLSILAGPNSDQALRDATREMQETQMSFNLQYLQLQNSMQNDNRQFITVSNIMKTKSTTIRDSINNVK